MNFQSQSLIAVIIVKTPYEEMSKDLDSGAYFSLINECVNRVNFLLVTHQFVKGSHVLSRAMYTLTVFK